MASCFWRGAVGGIHHGGVQHPAGAVDDRHLAAVGIARGQAHGDVALYRGLHQQGLQVQAEVGDGPSQAASVRSDRASRSREG